MNKRKCGVVLLLLLAIPSIYAQEKQRSWALTGYVKNMQTVIALDTSSNWITDNLIHNRLNFKWYPSESISFAIGARNRFMFGELIELITAYPDMLEEDNDLFDLSTVLAHDSSYILHSHVDRFYMDFSKGNWQIRVGRQRINWGMNLIWNPNDLFNVYSFFDFDYEERPGSDAIKVQYYTSASSSAELVWEVADKVEKMTWAGLYRFNKWGYDFQLLGGLVQQDFAIGGGWAGQIKGGGFRGEATYFHPKDNISDTTGVFTASISGDYTLKKGLYLHAGVLFNSEGTTGKAGGMNLLTEQTLSAKKLSFAKYSVFVQASYPITPLIRADLAGIFNPSDHSAFFGPSVYYSLAENLELLLTSQIFTGEAGSEFGDIGKVFYMRMRWSF